MIQGNRISSRFAPAGMALVLSMAAGAASAEEAKEEQSPWRVVLGAGVQSRPEYVGSDKDEVQALPVINIQYGRFFLGGVPGGGGGMGGGLGAHLFQNDTWDFGAIVTGDLDKPREEQDDARLRGMGDIDGTVRAGGFASYRLGWLTLSSSVLSDVGGKDQGTIASFDAEFAYRPTPRLSFTAGPGLMWADDKYLQTYFGVNADQAARSGYSQFAPESGAAIIRLNLGAQYELTKHWGVGARITASRLQGDAADSPIVADENQNSYAVFVRYRF
jgi:outer membrane protein